MGRGAADPGRTGSLPTAARGLLVIVVVLSVGFTVSVVPGVRAEPGFDARLDGWLKGAAYTGAAVLAALRPLRDRRCRLPWTLIALALGARAWGFASHAVIVRMQDPQPYPSVADAGWLVASLLLLAGLLILARASVATRAGTIALDTVLAALTVAALVTMLVWGPLVAAAAPGVSRAALATNVAYPLLDLALITTVGSLAAASGWRPPRALWWLGAGVVVSAAVDAAFLYQLTTGTFRPGSWLSGLSLVGTVAIAWAPWARRADGTGARSDDLPALAAPGVLGVICLGLLVVGTTRPVAPLVVGFAAAGILVVVLRTAVTFRLLRSVRTLRRAQQVAGVGHWLADADGSHAHWSNDVYELLGLDPRVVVAGDDAMDGVVHPDDAELVRQARRRGLETGEVDVVHRVHRPDGESRVVHVRAEADRDADGSLTGWYGTMQDVTDRERLAAALRESEATLQRVLTATNDGWWSQDLRTGTSFHSERWWRLHGLEPGTHPEDEDLWIRVTAPEDVERVVRLLNEAFERQEPTVSWTGRALHADGYEFPMLVRVSIDYDERGAPLRISGATSDLTDSMQAEQAKDAFISTLSHELRTPLTAIGGAIETVRAGVAGEVGPGVTQLLDLAARNALRLRRLVDDLLDLERLLAAPVGGGSAVQALRGVLERTIEEASPLALAKDVTFRFSAPKRPLFVRIDGNRIAQVLTNYLSNAVKFAPAGSTVEVVLEEHGQRVRTTVVDTGPGVPEHFRPRVFTAFSQAESTDVRTYGGTGLGLAISREIVQQHGGEVGFTSEVGRTAFWFELPAVDIPQPD